jgi:hypothetical protein
MGVRMRTDGDAEILRVLVDRIGRSEFEFGETVLLVVD